jgi:hypothetical protein
MNARIDLSPEAVRDDFVPSVLQRGVKSRGFSGLRTNPLQERVITHFHRVLRRFLKDPYDPPSPDAEA